MNKFIVICQQTPPLFTRSNTRWKITALWNRGTSTAPTMNNHRFWNIPNYQLLLYPHSIIGCFKSTTRSIRYCHLMDICKWNAWLGSLILKRHYPILMPLPTSVISERVLQVFLLITYRRI